MIDYEGSAPNLVGKRRWEPHNILGDWSLDLPMLGADVTALQEGFGGSADSPCNGSPQQLPAD